MLPEKELAALLKTRTPHDELYYNGVLYGPFGKRKTTTALRCSRNVACLLHADRGWNVIRNHPEEFTEDNVLPFKYEGLSQVRAFTEAIVEKQSIFAGVDLFIVDTISQIQANYIDWLNNNFTIFGREKAVPNPGAKGPDGKRLEEVSITGLPDYHLTRNKMRPIIEALVNAPFDVIFLAHDREPSPLEIQKGFLMKRPNLTNAVWEILGRDATFIGYMDENKKGDYTIDFKPTNRLAAKSQIASLTDKTILAEELPKYLWDWKNGQ